MNVLFLNYHHAPYRTPVLSQLKDKKYLFEVQVVTLFEVDLGHSYWGIDYDLSQDYFLDTKFALFGKRKWHPGIMTVLKSENYDCLVVSGFYHFTSLYLLLYGFIKRIPMVFMLDNIEAKNWNFQQRFWEYCKLKLLSKICQSFWVPGNASKNYLLKYGGVSDERVFFGAYTLDKAKIYEEYCVHKNNRNNLRSEFGFDDETRVFLMVANFTDNRQHLLLVNAFLKVRLKKTNIALVLLGEGKNLESVKALTKDNEAENPIFCLGGVKFDDLARYYALSDVYIHSGSEPYSTALTYATCVGLPIIAHSSVGSTSDILKNGKNGFLTQDNSLNSLADAIEKILSLDSDQLNKMGNSSKLLSDEYTVDFALNQLIEAVNFSTQENNQR
jgi:glycosyltransferase involved in cell wall biosynthesis